MGDLLKVGDRVAPRPSMMESVRVAAYSAGALTLAFAAVAGNTGSPVDNGRTLGLLGVAGVMAVCATRDAIKPDEEEEARAAQHILETEAAELRAEAIDAWKNSNLMAFIRGERPSDEWVSAWVRHNFAEETPALPQASAPAFPPAQYQPEFNPSIMQSDFEDDYEPAPVARSAPMSMTQAQMHQPMTTMTQPQPMPLVSAPVFNPQKRVERLNEGEFPFDSIAGFRCLVWVKGAKGSGKTSKVTHIEKLRHEQGQGVWRIDPMPPQADIHRRRGIQLYGANENWAEIEFAVSEFNALAKQRLQRRGEDSSYDPEKDQHVNLSMDEGAVLCQIDKAVLEEFWLHTVVRRIRQANMSVTIGTHGETKRFLGMTGDDCFTGVIDSLKEDAIMVQSHTLDSRKPQPFADITYQGRTWRVDCSHIQPHENVEFEPLPGMTVTPTQPHQPIAPAQPTQPRSPKQPMLQLMPQGGIMDDRPTASELELLPAVVSHTYQFEGMQPVVMKEPPILRLLNERDNVRAIVRALIDWGGVAEARKVQQQRQCAALRTPAGNPYNAEMIARYMAFLAENYSEYFAFDGKTLTTTNDEVLTWQLRK